MLTYAYLIKYGWGARGDGAQRGRHHHDPGRVRARIPLNGRLMGVRRGQVPCASCGPSRVRGQPRSLRSSEEAIDAEQMTSCIIPLFPFNSFFFC